jgi:hypothetical protein
MADQGACGGRAWPYPEQVPHRSKALGKVVGSDDYYVQQPIVRRDTGPQSDQRRNDLATIGNQDHRGVGLVFDTIYGDDMQSAADVGDEPEAGRDVGRHSPAPFLLRHRGGHDLGVVSRPAGDGKILGASQALHPTQVEEPGLRSKERSGRPGRRCGDPEISGQKVAGSPRDYSERHLGTDQGGRGLHGGPIAAEHRDHIHSLADAIFGQLTGIARSAGGEDFDLPPPTPQSPAHRVDRVLCGARRRRIGDEQRAGHLRIPVPTECRSRSDRGCWT